MKITLNVPSVYECEGVSLRPGSNDVDDKAAKKFLANPFVAADVKSGKLTIISGAKAKKVAASDAKVAASIKAELKRKEKALQDEADAEAARIKAEAEAKRKGSGD